MRLSILTTITRPEERQDFWIEALYNYLKIADEVVVIDGTPNTPNRPQDKRIKYIDLAWDYEWNWLELPSRFHLGRMECQGDWILKLDIDHLLHEDSFPVIQELLNNCPLDIEGLGMQKVTFSYGNRHYDKGLVLMFIRNRRDISFGENLDEKTDFCYPIRVTDTKHFVDKELGKEFDWKVGHSIKYYRSGISFYNYDYFFKTQDFARAEFFRMSKAYNRYFKSWPFGSDIDGAFHKFLEMQKARHDKCPYRTELKNHPEDIRKKVMNLKPEQFGHSAWNLIS